jgi:hypothetical protein
VLVVLAPAYQDYDAVCKAIRDFFVIFGKFTVYIEFGTAYPLFIIAFIQDAFH